MIPRFALLFFVSSGNSDLSRVDVIDSNSPKEVVSSFPVGSSPILAIACVPGVELGRLEWSDMYFTSLGLHCFGLCVEETNNIRMYFHVHGHCGIEASSSFESFDVHFCSNVHWKGRVELQLEFTSPS